MSERDRIYEVKATEKASLYSVRVRRAGPGAGVYGHLRRTHLDEAVNSTGGEARGDLMSCERGHARQHTVRLCPIGAELKANRRRHPKPREMVGGKRVSS